MDKQSADEKLGTLIAEISSEKEEIAKQIQIHKDEILETEKYLQSVYEKEDTDVRIFSPRNVESRYREEIEKSKRSIHSVEKMNQALYSKKNVLEKRISELCEVRDFLEHLQESSRDSLRQYSQQGQEEDVSSLLNHSSAEQEEDYRKHLQFAIQALNTDRKRIASELHDTVIQDLVHSVHKVELCTKYFDRDPVSARLELASIENYLRETIQKARDLVSDLRPMNFDDFGFCRTLLDSIEELRKNTSMVITADIDELQTGNQDKEILLYKIAMELIRNAVFHSDGSKVHVSVKMENEEIRLIVSDDGHGFIPKEDKDKHFGLELVKERVYLINGTIHINSTDQGTHIEVAVKNEKKREIYDKGYAGR